MAARKGVRRAPNDGGPDNQAVRLLLPALERARRLPISDELRDVLVRFTGELAVLLDPTTARQVR